MNLDEAKRLFVAWLAGIVVGFTLCLLTGCATGPPPMEYEQEEFEPVYQTLPLTNHE